MKKVIIPQKQSNTGSIHDIASEHYDREIKFRGKTKYAVVLASYYGKDMYSTHETEEAAIKEYNRQKEYSRQIIGVDGWPYLVNTFHDALGKLERDEDYREPYEVVG